MSSGLPSAARDTAIIGGITVAALFGLVVFVEPPGPPDVNGASPAPASPSDTASVGERPTAAVTVPATTVAGAAGDAPVAAATTVAGAAGAAATGASADAATAMAALSAPRGGVNSPAPAGTRAWTVAGSDYVTVADGYGTDLASSPEGWTVEDLPSPGPNLAAFAITNSAGVRLTVASAQVGADVIVTVVAG